MLRKSSEEVIENSIFGVCKDPSVSQRIIWAENRSNLLFNESLCVVELPSLDIVNSLFLNDGDNLYVAVCDISQYYNRLKAPMELIPLLGLPKIRAELLGLPHLYRSLTPCLTCIPMDTTFSVALAQAVTTAVLRRNNLPVPTSFLSLLDSILSPKRNFMLPYIQDINVIGTSATRANLDHSKFTNALSAANLWTDPKNDFCADYYHYKEAIRLSWWKEGVFPVEPSFALRIFRSKNQILSTKRSIPTQTRHIIGLWNYLFSP